MLILGSVSWKLISVPFYRVFFRTEPLKSKISLLEDVVWNPLSYPSQGSMFAACELYSHVSLLASVDPCPPEICPLSWVNSNIHKSEMSLPGSVDPPLLTK